MTIEELYADIRASRPGVSRQRIRAAMRRAQKDGAIRVVNGEVLMSDTLKQALGIDQPAPGVEKVEG